MTVSYVEIARHHHAGEPVPPLRDRAEAALADSELQGALRTMAGRFAVGRRIAMSEPGMDELRQRGIDIRRGGVEDLEGNLVRLEVSLKALGVHVHKADQRLGAAGHDVRRFEAIARVSGAARNSRWIAGYAARPGHATGAGRDAARAGDAAGAGGDTAGAG